MQNLLPISKGINVTALALQLRRNPALWNLNPGRTAHPNSPHQEVDDIWVRYGDDYTKDGQHESVWLDAATHLPDAKFHARAIMSLVGGDALGGVLITRIPPGKQVYPHIDQGWHAKYYDKFALQIAGHPQQAFCYEDGSHVSATGDLFWFHNQASHWVTNDSPCERITMIVCVKLDKPFGG